MNSLKEVRGGGNTVPLDVVLAQVAAYREAPETPAAAEPPPASIPEVATPPVPRRRRPRSKSLDSFIVMNNLVCKDADGTVREQYDRLEVMADVFRDKKKVRLFTPYEAVQHCEANGMFLPSFGLSCAMLQWLWDHRAQPEAASILQQYKDRLFEVHINGSTALMHGDDFLTMPNGALTTVYHAIKNGALRVENEEDVAKVIAVEW